MIMMEVPSTISTSDHWQPQMLIASGMRSNDDSHSIEIFGDVVYRATANVAPVVHPIAVFIEEACIISNGTRVVSTTIGNYDIG